MKNTPRSKTWQRNAVAVAIASCFVIATPLYANPIGPSIANGVVSMAQQGNSLNITNSPGAIINWQSFSIGASEATRFIQQSAASSVLNRVTGVNPSSILGALQSNGRVFLINPNGVLFGAGAQVDVAGLVVSTLNLSNADFLAGRYNFTARAGAGGIENQGNLTALPGGQLYLVAPSLNNSGIITSPQGDIVLAAGNSVELVNANSPDMRVVISAPDNQAINLGSIVANSGRVGIYAGLINHHGIVSADTATVGATGKITFKATTDINLEPGSVTSASGAPGGVHDGGEVRLIADGKLAMRSGSQVHVDGGVDGGNGGFLELSGKTGLVLHGIYSGRAHKAGYRNGSLLLDPLDINIISGGSYGMASSNIAASASSGATFNIDPASLNGGWADVSLAALNNITVQSAISNADINNGAAGGSLTLTAGNDITVGAQIGLPSAGRFNHDLTLTAGNNVNVNNSIYLGSNTLTLAANALGAGTSGYVYINPGVTMDTLGAMHISGVDLTVGSSGHASLQTTVSAGGLLSINMSRDINIYGGAAAFGSSNQTVVKGGAVDLHGRNLSLLAGSMSGSGSFTGNGNAELRSTSGDVGITLTGGGLILSGNNASAFGSRAQTADAIIYAAQDVVIHSADSVTLNGASGQVLASASNATASGNAVIEAARDVIITTAGALTLNGGTAMTQNWGDSPMHAHANATISAGNDITITAGSLRLQGGSATEGNSGSGGGSATAKAMIEANRTVLIKTDGAVELFGGSASRLIGSADASARINAGSIEIGGGLTITGNVNARAASLALTGGSGSSFANASTALSAPFGNILVNVNGDVSMTDGGGNIPETSAAIDAGVGNVTLVAAGGNFINNSGNASPITAGRILIYSTIPTSDTLNGMTADFKRYNCTYAAGCLTAGTAIPATGNGFLYSYAPALAVTADAQSKIYGAADPAFSYTVSGFEFGDDAVTALSGTLGRAAGENVGSYAINQGVLLSPLGYTISLTGNNLGITPASLSVIADALSKVYGSADPVLTYAATGFQFSDTAGTALTGSLSRVAGENVGLYAINQGSLAGANYTITYTGNNLGITAAPAPAPAAPVDVVQPVLNTALDGVLETVALPILNGPLLAAVEQSGEQENPLNKKPTYTCQ
ncbi:MAG: MBG domain-containing protein [Gallionella sp.]|nr:MBG domain-containing protein [Gallionella sp.]